MRAVVIEQPGPPEVLRLQDRPVPEPETGWVLIRVRAFGLNRSELFTRQGHSPTVTFPRILGIEAVGEIVAAPGTELSPGQIVATAMGGLGVRRENRIESRARGLCSLAKPEEEGDAHAGTRRRRLAVRGRGACNATRVGVETHDPRNRRVDARLTPTLITAGHCPVN